MADWVALIPGCMYQPDLHIWSYGFDKWMESVSLSNEAREKINCWMTVKSEISH